jgi:hypothetical protein
MHETQRMNHHAGGNGPSGSLAPVCHKRIVARFGVYGKPRDCPEIAYIQQFKVHLLVDF